MAAEAAASEAEANSAVSTAAIAIVPPAVALAASFGLGLTGEQQGLIVAMVGSITALAAALHRRRRARRA